MFLVIMSLAVGLCLSAAAISVGSIWESIANVGGILDKRRKSKILNLNGIAREYADGRTPKPEDVAIALETAGKSEQDLKAMVQRLLDRRELHRVTKLAEPVPARRAERQRKTEAAAATMKAAQQAYNDSMAPIFEEERLDAAIERNADRAKTHLQSTASHEDNSALEEAGRAVLAARAQLDEVVHESARLEDAIGFWRKELDDHFSSHKPKHQSNIKKLTQDVEAAKVRIASIAAQLPELQEAISAALKAEQEASDSLVAVV